MLHCLFLDARGAFCRNDSISSPNKSFSFVFDLIIIYFDCYYLMLIVCCLTSKEATCPGPGIYVQPLCLDSFSYSESLRNQVSFISHIIQFVHATALSLLSTLYNCHGHTNIRLIYLVLTLLVGTIFTLWERDMPIVKSNPMDFIKTKLSIH